MLKIKIPGRPELKLKHLLLDYNGTLAQDGVLLAGVRQRLELLSASLSIRILTADTFGSAAAQTQGLNASLEIIPPEQQDRAKLAVAAGLVSKNCVCIGNGANDTLMLQEAGLGIAVCQGEGLATTCMLAADIICPDIEKALDLLLHTQRLVATLRN